MTLKLSSETWAQVRYEYEHTDKPVDDICLDYGVSPGTLRDRVRRWRWTRRNEPVSLEGPPPMAPIRPLPPLGPAMTPVDASAPAEPAGDFRAPLEPADSPSDRAAVGFALPARTSEEPSSDPAELVPQLLGAIARLLPATEAAIARLAAAPLAPREVERAARALTSFSGTLRELNEVLSRHQPAATGARLCTCDYPDDDDAFRNEFARRIRAFLDSHTTDEEWELRGRPPKDFVPYGG